MNTHRRHAGLICSAGLNLALAGLLFSLLKPPGNRRPALTPDREPVANPTPENLSTTARAPALIVTNRFHWGLLESTNYQAYAANLRASGCPENTLRDIIVADVERAYAVKRATAPLGAGFWSCGPKREAATRAHEQNKTALESEQRDLLLTLVGTGGSHQGRHSSDDLLELAIMHFLLGPLPEGVPEQVLEVIQRGSAMEDELRDQARGILLPADEARLAESKGQTLAEIQRLLTPGQFEEFTARQAAMGLFDDSPQAFRVTPAELRAIALIHVSVFGALDEKPFRLIRNDEEPDNKREEFQARLKALLGDRRFAEYQRDTDSDFRSVEP